MRKIEPSWVAWAKEQVALLRDGGFLIFPSDGAVLQVNKGPKTLTLISCLPSWVGSENEDVNSRCFAMTGYQYVRPDDVPTTPETTLNEVFGNLQRYASDLPMLKKGIGTIFGVNVQQLMARMGKKDPINPVTIRGRNATDTGPGNFTVGRLWIGNDSIPDSSHRFDPSAFRAKRWDKPITMVLWNDEKQLTPTEAKGTTAIVVDEEDFLPSVKLLERDAIDLKVWGRPSQISQEKMSVTFRRSSGQAAMTITVSGGGEGEVAESVVVDYNKFIEGLGHLFPNGELGS